MECHHKKEYCNIQSEVEYQKSQLEAWRKVLRGELHIFFHFPYALVYRINSRFLVIPFSNPPLQSISKWTKWNEFQNYSITGIVYLFTKLKRRILLMDYVIVVLCLDSRSWANIQSVRSSPIQESFAYGILTFFVIIDTFTVFKWFAMPEELSPVVCASHGWENLSRNTLECPK